MNNEKFYIQRLRTLLYFQAKLIKENDKLTDEEKQRQLLLVSILGGNIDMFINEVYVNKGVAR